MIDFTPFDTDAKLYNVITKNLDALKNDRKPWEALWDREIKIFQPRRFDLLRTAQKGQQYGARVFDGHPQNAANKFVLGLLGYMMSRSVPWIQFAASDQKKMQDDQVKKYAQEVAEQVLWSFNSRSDFYGSAVWFAKDSTVIGTGIQIPEEDLENGRMRYQTIHPGESYVSLDKNGRAGIYLRPFKMTAITMLQRFGKENLPPDILNNAEAKGGGNPFMESDVLYGMYKNVKSTGNDAIKPVDRNWKVFYLLISSAATKQKILQKTGTNLGPLSWMQGVEPGQSYGTSLAADSLTEALQVNKYGQLLLQSYHNLVQPQLLAHKNLRNKIRRNAGGITYSDDPQKQTVERLYGSQASDTNTANPELDRIHASIDDKFFIRFFEAILAVTSGSKTAFEVSQIMGEKATLMGSISGDFETQYLEEAVKLQFEFEKKAGRLPEPPDILFDEAGNAEIDINFVGPLAQLQKSILESRPIVNSVALIGQIAQIWPQSVIKINEFDLIEQAGIAMGLKQDLYKSDEELQEILDEVARKQQIQDNIAAGTAIAGAVPDVSKAVEPGSVLATVTEAAG